MARDHKQIEAFKAAALRCPLPSSIDLVGERWAFLIVRGALNGLQHFEEFQGCLGIARNILSDRLAKMVAGGILRRAADPDDRRKVIYSLTRKGEALLPVVLALRQWGLDWGHGSNDRVAADIRDGQPIRKIAILAHDGRELALDELMWLDPEGKGYRLPERIVPPGDAVDAA
ncbi:MULTISPECIES: winged helix-turn-helix transcriptional regulator [Sphingomonas]|uniref:winged helix-turn-helix transcriptional regulator n=1 Tax=Sphingomonas TaxID=13687 RepID=UPI001F07ACBC|nr:MULTISPECIES: helix-turn-helix domain-containing protein [Sphingomonas]